MIIRMFNMSPETLVHREVGNSISKKDKRIIEMLDDNLSYVESYIKYTKANCFGDMETFDHIDYMTEDFDPDLLDTITKTACYAMMKEIKAKIDYYASGHEFIKGVIS